MGPQGGEEENCWFSSAKSSGWWGHSSPPRSLSSSPTMGMAGPGVPSLGSWPWALTWRRRRWLTRPSGSREATLVQAGGGSTLKSSSNASGAVLTPSLNGPWAGSQEIWFLSLCHPPRNHQNLIKSLYFYYSPDSHLSQDLEALVWHHRH